LQRRTACRAREHGSSLRRWTTDSREGRDFPAEDLDANKKYRKSRPRKSLIRRSMGGAYSRSENSITGRKLLQTQHDGILAKDNNANSLMNPLSLS